MKLKILIISTLLVSTIACEGSKKKKKFSPGDNMRSLLAKEKCNRRKNEGFKWENNSCIKLTEDSAELGKEPQTTIKEVVCDRSVLFNGEVPKNNNDEICTEITGNLHIHNTTFTSLEGLNAITSVGGDLSITFNTALINLEGLNSLTSVNGDILFIYNPTLTSLKGLNAIISVGGDISISNNNSLTSIEGLNNLTSIGKDLSIKVNEVLLNLKGLDSLISIGGQLSIENNPALTSLEGLNALTFVGGSFSIWDNINLNNNIFLSSLEELNSYFNPPVE